MKKYIEDFEYNLNYEEIVLYIGDLSDDEIKLLKEQCKEDCINKEYRWEYIENGSKFFYVENCDLQDCNGIELLDCIQNDYNFYLLKHDKNGFYYEKRGDKMIAYESVNDINVNNIIIERNEALKELDKFRPFTSAYEMKKEIERLNNIINEIEKDMTEKCHKEIDYQSKIMQSDLMQGDYPVSYYYAEQNEKLLNYYLNKLKDLKGEDK